MASPQRQTTSSSQGLTAQLRGGPRSIENAVHRGISTGMKAVSLVVSRKTAGVPPKTPLNHLSAVQLSVHHAVQWNCCPLVNRNGWFDLARNM
eukprot:s169_g4.t1